MLNFISEIKKQIIFIDIAILKFINIKLYNRYFAEFIRFISNDIFLALVVFLGLIFFFLKRKIEYKDKINFMLVLWGIIFVNLINTFFLKPFFKRPRPSAVFSDVILLAEMKKLGYAFPSTHSAMFAFFIFLLWKDYVNLRPFLLFLFFSVCFFCVYTGGHYPLDVIAGIIIGWIFFIIFNRIREFMIKKGEKKIEKIN